MITTLSAISGKCKTYLSEGRTPKRQTIMSVEHPFPSTCTERFIL